MEVNPLKFAIDQDGTILSAPVQFRAIMCALKAAGHHITVLTGDTGGWPMGQAGWDKKYSMLESVGVTDCWDELVFIELTDQALADAKGQWCAANGIAVLIDNTKANAQAAIDNRIPLALVPWETRN